ncbi:opioid growth factor receptor-like protein 1 [Mizuhopecten yessoensis]|uniref:Opioid growth factor receptor-like protein 1 n=1 Tax=Mizuhopecten yessoensis TaxID=6573 RepID=A0A210Q3H8_MIZYE|nr:opioid growth factor receptor-like protein 1 [Mizuhopecten yessoensis]OWF43262.1 Opioid growth factor receptor-like protein 1 [Mizuhopecten yessoensis]
MSKSSNTRSNKTSSSEGSVSSKDKFKQTTMGNSESTDESPTQRGRAGGGSRHTFKPSFFRKWSDKDTEQYRLGYPGKKDHPNQKENLLFYTGKMPSHPDGDYIDNIHENWWGDYRLLESHHGYIQWLFPIRESGMNFYSQELQLHEIEKMKEDKKALARVLKSYRLMLDFYGMELENEETGQIKRGEHWRSQFRNLNRSFHNYLRITRILKSLGEFGYEYLKRPFVEFVLQEALETGELSNVLESCVNYWIGTLKDDGVRAQLLDYIRKVESGLGEQDTPEADESVMEEDEGRGAQSHGKDSTSRTSKGESNWNDSRANTNKSPDVDVEFSDDSHEGEMLAKADLLESADRNVDTGSSVCDTNVKGGPEEVQMEVGDSSTGESNTQPQTAETQPLSLSQV